LEAYTRARLHDELQLANRILHMVDGHSQRSYGATCGDLTVGNDESFVDDIRDLFAVVRSGQTALPLTGAMPFVAPALFADFKRADEVIAVVESMRGQNNAWLVIGMHGVGAGTHNNFMEADEHRSLVDWMASQHDWLDAVTMLEAARELQKTGDEHG
jgi:GTP:adenosylcobinamide-phosphate guanylyltransferase